MNQSNHEVVKSVGIDIGTTTTQLVISTLIVKNIAPGTLVPRMQITDKTVDYKSGIYFTPIRDHTIVDAAKIEDLVRSEFVKAGVSPEEIDTGAVIITGETAKKENAKRISRQIAGLAGDFVVATAGGKLESIIAGKGSGAADYSRTNYCTVANIDMGGGTSNVGIFRNGKALDSCCINIGGRLLQIDRNTGTVTYISAPMDAILEDCGVNLRVNMQAEPGTLAKICARMADVVYECISSKSPGRLAKLLLMTEPLRLDYTIDVVMISGGVADYVYKDGFEPTLQETIQYGDVGPQLGWAVNRSFSSKGVKLIRPTETIRATVIGAGVQMLDVSGSTISVADDRLPLKNIPVMIPFSDAVPADEWEIARKVGQSIDNFYMADELENLAIALQGNQYFSFAEIREIAKGIIRGSEKLIRAGLPIIVVLEQDSGKALGQTLKYLKPEADVICIDQIKVDEGDYIDIGKSIAGGSVVPVVIKTLVFETKQV